MPQELRRLIADEASELTAVTMVWTGSPMIAAQEMCRANHDLPSIITKIIEGSRCTRVLLAVCVIHCIVGRGNGGLDATDRSLSELRAGKGRITVAGTQHGGAIAIFSYCSRVKVITLLTTAHRFDAWPIYLLAGNRSYRHLTAAVLCSATARRSLGLIGSRSTSVRSGLTLNIISILSLASRSGSCQNPMPRWRKEQQQAKAIRLCGYSARMESSTSEFNSWKG